MQTGDRVRRLGLDGPTGPVGEVVRVLGGLSVGIVRVRWMEHGDLDGNQRESLEATANLEVVGFLGGFFRRQHVGGTE